MDRESLFMRWLDGENLTKEELNELESWELFKDYVKIAQTANRFQPELLNLDKTWNEFRNKLDAHSKKRQPIKTYKNYLWYAAAIFVGILVVGALLLKPFDDEVFKAGYEQMVELKLPDASDVVVNKNSSLSYDISSWKSSRTLQLKGEAYFKVQKGSVFTVETPAGKVQVLGTQFDVKYRDYMFQVSCYEGKVQVSHHNTQTILTPGQQITWVGNSIKRTAFSQNVPSWISQKALYQEIPLKILLEELKIYYPIDIIITSEIDLDQTFTGAFVTNDLENALKSVLAPFKLKADIQGNTVTIF